MSFLYKQNFGYGVLGSDLAGGATAMTMSPGHNFSTDASKNFKVLIWDRTTYPEPADDANREIVTATYSGTVDIYNITRGDESTTPVAHASGSACHMTITAAMLAEFEVQVPPYVVGFYLTAGPTKFESSLTNSSYAKVGELYLPRGGALTIVFGIRDTSPTNGVNGQIYRNGVAVGTRRSSINDGSWYEFSENISGWSAGDLCQIYAYSAGASYAAGAMRIYEGVPIREVESSKPLEFWGTGVPDASLGNQGDTYKRTDGSTSTSLYVKTGSTTWTAK